MALHPYILYLSRYRPMSPDWLAFRSSKAFITFVLAYAIFVDQFVFTSIVPVAPFALRERNHIPEEDVQSWVSILLSVYGASMFVACPIFGWWCDRTASRKMPFLVGLIFIVLSTIMLWLSPNVNLAIVSRIVQGIAGAMVWVTTLAILVDTVGQEEIGQYTGYLAIGMNLGTVLGPLLGGVVFDHLGYNAVYIMGICFIVGDIILRLFMVERGLPEVKVVDPEAESVVSTTTPPQSEEKKRDISVVESAIPKPQPTAPDLELHTDTAKSLAPPRRLPAVITLLFSPRFLAALFAVVMQAVIGDTFKVSLPLYVAQTFSWTSSGAGLTFLPLALPALLGPLFGYLTDRFGPRWLAVSGFALITPCLVLLRLITHNSPGQKALLFVLLTLTGICMTATLEPLMAEITYAVSEEDAREAARTGVVSKTSYAQAYGLFNAAWSLGNTVGPVAAGMVMQKHGWKAMTLSVGVVTGVTVVPTMLWCGGWIFGKKLLKS